jgi:hypothetical protein
MTEYQQNNVSRAVWPWPASAETSEAQSKGDRRKPALIQTAVMTVIALILTWGLHKPVLGTVVFVLAGIVLATGFLWVRAFDAIERGGKALGRWVAVALTWILLVPFYYIVFAPGRLFLVLSGKDPLCRAFPTDEPTYWVPRPEVDNEKHFKKQY